MFAWEPIYKYFGDQFKFISWDYRGLFTSEKPANQKDLSIVHHAKDLECLLKHEKIKKTILGGWSMGVQVCLEFYRSHSRQCRGLYLINGTSGNPYDTALNTPIAKYIVPTINQLLKSIMPHVQPTIRPIAKMAIKSDDFIKIISKLGLVHENLNPTIFKKIASEIINTDLAVLHEILDQMAEHDASDVLEKIKVPTLIMAGTHDKMTPSHTAETMAKKIDHAELFIINHSSHYSLLEFPDRITKRLEQFLKEHFL